jgi:hypothetical protein
MLCYICRHGLVLLSSVHPKENNYTTIVPKRSFDLCTEVVQASFSTYFLDYLFNIVKC